MRRISNGRGRPALLFNEAPNMFEISKISYDGSNA